MRGIQMSKDQIRHVLPHHVKGHDTVMGEKKWRNPHLQVSRQAKSDAFLVIYDQYFLAHNIYLILYALHPQSYTQALPTGSSMMNFVPFGMLSFTDETVVIGNNSVYNSQPEASSRFLSKNKAQKVSACLRRQCHVRIRDNESNHSQLRVMDALDVYRPFVVDRRNGVVQKIDQYPFHLVLSSWSGEWSCRV
jgi:hypothetical protein